MENYIYKRLSRSIKVNGYNRSDLELMRGLFNKLINDKDTIFTPKENIMYLKACLCYGFDPVRLFDYDDPRRINEMYYIMINSPSKKRIIGGLKKYYGITDMDEEEELANMIVKSVKDEIENSTNDYRTSAAIGLSYYRDRRFNKEKLIRRLYELNEVPAECLAESLGSLRLWIPSLMYKAMYSVSMMSRCKFDKYGNKRLN